MTQLYQEVLNDPRYEKSDQLKYYKTKIWSRLNAVKKDLHKIVAREERRGTRRKKDEQALVDEVNQSLSSHIALVGYSMGGPAHVLTHASGARGGGGVADHSQLLIDLIERVIAPDFWDSNGGPGSIFYYAPAHALVISATGDIHHKIGGALHGLRR